MLSWFTDWVLEAIRRIMRVKLLDRVPEEVINDDNKVRKWMCEIVGEEWKVFYDFLKGKNFRLGKLKINETSINKIFLIKIYQLVAQNCTKYLQ